MAVLVDKCQVVRDRCQRGRLEGGIKFDFFGICKAAKGS
jgi:hypothetical protein